MTQPTIPAGYALVPVEPTEAMQLAVCELERRVGPDAVLGLSRMWSAMLAAAPRPPEQPTIAGEREAVYRAIALIRQPGRDFRLCPPYREDPAWALADAALGAILARPSVRDGEVERGYRAAIATIRSWAEGFSDQMTRRRLRAVAADLETNRETILAALSASDGKEGVS